MSLTRSLRGRAATALAALTVLTSVAAVAPGPTRAAGGDGLRAAVNDYRADANLPPVAGTALLDDIARARADRLVELDRMEHDIDYVTDRLNRAGVCWSGVGEILAWEKGWPDYDYQRTVTAWFNSPTHHDIMLGADYIAAGGAWASGPDLQHYSVMVFVVLCSQPAAQAQTSSLQPTDRYDPDRGLVMARGRHKVYRLSANGNILGRRTVYLDRQIVRTSSGRAKHGGHVWLKISSGGFSGLWVLERSTQFVRGMTGQAFFDPPIELVVRKGYYVGARFDWLGRVTSSRAKRYYHARLVAASARAIINGQRYYKFAEGPLAGFWVRDTADIYPR